MQGAIAAALLHRRRCCLHRQSGVPGASFHDSSCRQSMTTTAKLSHDRQSWKSRARTLLLGEQDVCVFCYAFLVDGPCSVLYSALRMASLFFLILGCILLTSVPTACVGIPAKISDV